MAVAAVPPTAPTVSAPSPASEPTELARPALPALTGAAAPPEPTALTASEAMPAPPRENAPRDAQIAASSRPQAAPLQAAGPTAPLSAVAASQPSRIGRSPEPASAPAVATAAAAPGTARTLASGGGSQAPAEPSVQDQQPGAAATLRSPASPYIVREDVQYRDGPGMGTAVLGNLAPGQRISVVGWERGWYAFQFPGETDQRKAWVSGRFVQPAEPPAGPQ